MKSLQEIIGATPVYHEETDDYTPSKASLAIMCPPKTNYDGHVFENPYTKGEMKILVLGVDEHHLVCKNDTKFRTGDHPVELFVTLKHLSEAGFGVDFATPRGNCLAFEDFAWPEKDETILSFADSLKSQYTYPKKIEDVANELNADSPYAAVFFPGGQGVINQLPNSDNVKKVLQWAIQHNKDIITICHGPSALLALAKDEDPDSFPFKGYEIEDFPKSGDQLGVKVGYLPGEMPWFFNDELEKLGMKLRTKLPIGGVHVDRQLISGDSPLAANKLGKTAAEILLTKYR